MQSRGTNEPEKLDVVLERPKLKRVVKSARQLTEIDRVLDQCIPETCVGHCRAMSLRKGCLTLVVDSANWVLPLRFHQLQIIAALQQVAKLNIGNLVFKVRPGLTKSGKAVRIPTTPKKSPKPLSEDTASQLRASANSIKNPALKSALERLASRCKK